MNKSQKISFKFRIDGKICSSIKDQISKERKILNLAFWQSLKYNGDWTLIQEIVLVALLSAMYICGISFATIETVVMNLAHVKGGVAWDQTETVAPQLLKA